MVILRNFFREACCTRPRDTKIACCVCFPALGGHAVGLSDGGDGGAGADLPDTRRRDLALARKGNGFGREKMVFESRFIRRPVLLHLLPTTRPSRVSLSPRRLLSRSFQLGGHRRPQQRRQPGFNPPRQMSITYQPCQKRFQCRRVRTLLLLAALVSFDPLVSADACRCTAPYSCVSRLWHF